MPDAVNTIGDLALISLLLHPWGHSNAGSQAAVPGSVGVLPWRERGIPVEVNYQTGGEYWDPSAGTAADQANLHGGGFSMVDKVGSRSGEDFALANALYKALYMAGLPRKITKDIWYRQGDIGGVKDQSGNKYTAELLGLSALGDLAKSQGWMDGNVRFDVVNGTPSVFYETRW